MLTEKKEKQFISSSQAKIDTIDSFASATQFKKTGMFKWVYKTREKQRLNAKKESLMIRLLEKEKEFAKLIKKEDIIKTRLKHLLDECNEYNESNKHEKLKKLPSILQTLKILETQHKANNQHDSHNIPSSGKKVSFDLTKNKIHEIPCRPNPLELLQENQLSANRTTLLNSQIALNRNKFFKQERIDETQVIRIKKTNCITELKKQ